MISFSVNGEAVTVQYPYSTRLIWVLKEHLGLNGTKYGCGNGTCGACTVLVNDKPRRACVIEIHEVAGAEVTTIEGIPDSHPVKRAWLEERVARCGYCQPGQIMSAVGLLKRTSSPTEFDIETAMSGNVCRCGTYSRIRKAILRAVEFQRGDS